MSDADELWFRVDASPAIGTGHFMRCFALAEQWVVDGGRAVFVSSAPSALRERLSPLGIGFVEARRSGSADADLATAQWAIPRGVATVVDGYHFSADEIAAYREDRFLVLFDDAGDSSRHACDLLVDHGVLAVTASGGPARHGGRERLLGPRYFPIRRGLRDAGREPRPARDSRHVLVTVGGTDPGGHSLRLLEALRPISLAGLEVRVVVGPLADSRPQLTAAAERSPYRVEIVRGADMAALMRWADVAVSAAGTTSLELAHLGVPAVLVTVVENQSGCGQRLEQLGVGIAIGEVDGWDTGELRDAVSRLLDDPQRRLAMSARGRELVDGFGAERIATRIRDR